MTKHHPPLMVSRILRTWMLAALLVGGVALPTFASPLEVLITPRPPFYIVDEGKPVGGIVAGPAANIFAVAELEVRWTVVSFNRQLQLIEDNRTPLCGIGWYKNPSREKFATFTEYIYQDKALVALSRSDNQAVMAHQDFRSLVADRSLAMGRKLGFSYGAVVDEMVEAVKPKSITTDQNALGMVRMLVGGRFDYMITGPEETKHVIETLGINPERVAMIELPDLPLQNKRYIMCSQSVEESIIAKLNEVILSLRR